MIEKVGSVSFPLGRLGRLLLLSAVGVGGLFMMHRQEILSGFQVVIGEPGDDRLVNWVLEHGYRWLRGDEAHASFWSPPYFYPEKNVSAFTESMLGLQPFYTPLRLAGLGPQTALAALALTLAALNFGAFFLLARRFVGFSFGASTAGAFLFAFSSPRAVSLNHLQMTAGFFEVAAVAALVAIFAQRRSGRGWIALFWVSCLMQAYAGLYHAWMFALFLSLGAAVALAHESTRSTLLAELRRRPLAWFGGAVLTLAAAWPLAAPYLAAARTLGPHPLAVTWLLLPRPESWLNLGPGSLLFGRFSDQIWRPELPFEWTHRLGFGCLTWGLVFWGAASAWKQRQQSVRIPVLAFFLGVLLATRWPGGWSLWRGVVELVPGATSMRSVGRLAIVGLLASALCLAIAWQRLEASRRWRAWLLPIAAVVVLEQVQTPPTYRRGPVLASLVDLVQRVPSDCKAFYFTSLDPRAAPHHVHLTAMWATMLNGIPTINGYSSGTPPGWGLNDAVVHSPDAEPELRRALQNWIAARRVHDPVCWVRWDGREDHAAEVERVPGVPAIAGRVTGFTVEEIERR